MSSPSRPTPSITILSNAVQSTGDRDALERLKRFGGAALVSQMVALFLEEAPRRITAIRDALRSGDLPAARQVAHSLKSSCGQMGALAMQELSRHIETDTDEAVMARCLDQLPGELARYTAWLDALSLQEGA
jgi:HPt (histidine-containing phosphotransfer) domain-containing protein